MILIEELGKHKIVMDTWLCCISKSRMPEFYYDCIDKYVDRADFQKSKYVIKPDMNDEYQCCFFSVLIVLIY